MDPIKQRPLPDPEAFKPNADKKPKPPERAVFDEDGKERSAPDQKIEYNKARDRRKQ